MVLHMAMGLCMGTALRMAMGLCMGIAMLMAMGLHMPIPSTMGTTMQETRDGWRVKGKSGQRRSLEAQ